MPAEDCKTWNIEKETVGEVIKFLQNQKLINYNSTDTGYVENARTELFFIRIKDSGDARNEYYKIKRVFKELYPEESEIEEYASYSHQTFFHEKKISFSPCAIQSLNTVNYENVIVITAHVVSANMAIGLPGIVLQIHALLNKQNKNVNLLCEKKRIEIIALCEQLNINHKQNSAGNSS